MRWRRPDRDSLMFMMFVILMLLMMWGKVLLEGRTMMTIWMAR